MAERPGSGYVGRFAPSPTGPLHFGSLIAAVGSYLQARSLGGRWLLRIEDLDPPREEPGATDAILRALEVYGFEWDGPVVYQSQRLAAYEAALAELDDGGLLYACACSRQQVRAAGDRGSYGTIYPGTCAGLGLAPGSGRALRVRTHDRAIPFTDGLQGPCSQRLRSELGDFVVRRTDGYIAYQLAIVVDDAWQGISEVVRGSDLLDSTPRQIYLQQLLGRPTPHYLHLPVALDAQGNKLSKQTGATALPADDPIPSLLRALRFLGQPVGDELREAEPAELLKAAAAAWNPGTVPRRFRAVD